ncbi:DUF3634 family protein [Algiphilus aromaticivorans]|uniref:DUF3634 family protein n=1 Tax=Algiphilus aromaticivorans TaxID=382454 RepID=UPI0006933BEA|nr:DUF3634 family protein [Algiphilus aromaticivorans]
MAESGPRTQGRRLALIAALRLRGAQFALLRDGGRTQTLFGKPPTGFVSACDEILEQKGIRRTWLAQAGRGARARLLFAEDLPEGVRQRIRNVWTPPRRPTTAGSGKRA